MSPDVPQCLSPPLNFQPLRLSLIHGNVSVARSPQNVSEVFPFPTRVLVDSPSHNTYLLNKWTLRKNPKQATTLQTHYLKDRYCVSSFSSPVFQSVAITSQSQHLFSQNGSLDREASARVGAGGRVGRGLVI